MNLVGIIVALVTLLQLVPPLAVRPFAVSLSALQGAEQRTPTITYRIVDPGESAPSFVPSESLGVAVTAQAAAVQDVQSGSILWEKNSDDVRPIASITKLVTLMALAKASQATSTDVTIEAVDTVPYGGAEFMVGERISRDDLIGAAIIASDNTAIRALVRTAGVYPTIVIDAMNTIASDLHVTNTHFVDVTGLAPENVSTVRDVLILSEQAFKDEIIARYAGKRTHSFTAATGRSHLVRSTNQLLGSSLVAISAGKTGHVDESGFNIVAELLVNGHVLRVVMLGSETNADRFQDVKALAWWVAKHYSW